MNNTELQARACAAGSRPLPTSEPLSCAGQFAREPATIEDQDAWMDTQWVYPPMTDDEGREYERQEMMDGQSREAEQRERSRGCHGTGFPYYND